MISLVSKNYNGLLRFLLWGLLFAVQACTGESEKDPNEKASTEFTVNTATTGEGTILPTSARVAFGESASFAIAPATGYALDSVTGCRGRLTDSTYTIDRVTADCSISVNFLAAHTVRTSAGANGRLSPTSASVRHGSTTTILITPDAEYRIAAVDGCSGTLSGNTYTTGAITSDCTVSATFVEDVVALTYVVNSVAGKGGRVTPNSVIVGDSALAEFSIAVEPGYDVVGVTGCNGVLSGKVYTTGAVTSDCIVRAAFAVQSLTVRTTAGVGGELTPPSQTVEYGASASFTAVPQTGYDIDVVEGCGGTLTGNMFTTAAVTADCTVSVGFSLKPLAAPSAVRAMVSGNGITISWQAVERAEEYRVYRSDREGVSTADTLLYEGSGLTALHNGVDLDIQYRYAVQSVTGTIESPLSAEISARGIGGRPSLNLDPGDQHVTVSLFRVRGATGYRLFWNTTGDVTDSDESLDLGVRTVFAHTSLTNQTKYFYRVQAYNAFAETTLSREDDATPDVWQFAAHFVTGDALNDVVKFGDRLVAVGEHGAIITSDDNGVSWTARKSNTQSDLRDIAVTPSGDLVVASARWGLLTSADGINWNYDIACSAFKGTTRILNLPNGNLWATGGGDNSVYESTDGGASWSLIYEPRIGSRGGVAAVNPQGLVINQTFFADGFQKWSGAGWTPLPAVFTPAAADLIWFPPASHFVVTATGVVYSSPDGVEEWAGIRLGGSLRLAGLSLTSDNTLLLGGSVGTIRTSVDSTTWVERPSGTRRDLSRVVELEENSYIAVGDGGAVLQSSDLESWSKRDGAITEQFPQAMFATSGGVFISINGDEIHRSDDGIVWSVVETGIDIGDFTETPSGTIMAVGVSVQTNTNVVYLSENEGATWSLTAAPDSGLGRLEGVAFGDAGYVALTRSLQSTISVSADGLDWAPVNGTAIGELGSFLRHIAWDPKNKLYIVSGVFSLYTSPDGATWTKRTATSGNLGGAVVTNAAGVSLAARTGIFRSTNGTTWESVGNSSIGSISAVAWTGDRFVAMNRNMVAHSLDGLNWTAIEASFDIDLRTIAGNANKLVAAGDRGVHLHYTILP